jgi:hypothetical protein
MSSRGSFAINGHVSVKEYETIRVTENGVKILKGIGKNHTLPDYSNSPNSIYAKLHKSGDLQELRFYDENCNLYFEIGYHRESNLANEKNVLHYHTIKNLDRSKAFPMTNNIKEKFKKYLKEFNLYDKC